MPPAYAQDSTRGADRGHDAGHARTDRQPERCGGGSMSRADIAKAVIGALIAVPVWYAMMIILMAL